MQVEARHGRTRPVEISPALFRKLSFAAALALYAIVSSGALVRLTASGLGCESWPGCTDANPFPEKDYHAFVEFGNRVFGLLPISLTVLVALAAVRTPGVPRWTVRLAFLVALGTLAQAPLGLLTIRLDLHPLAVISHLLLAFLVLGGGIVVALEARALERRLHSWPVPHELRTAGLVLVGSCLALVTTGAFVTAAGPHSGGTEIRRLGTPTIALAAHVPAAALFGAVLMFTLGYLAARRAAAPLLLRLALGVLGLLVAQSAVGELQWRTELPWWLVLVHVSLAGAVWGGTVALVTLFFRGAGPPGRMRA